MGNTLIARFDRSKPFYPLVANYFAALIGYKELQDTRDAFTGRSNLLLWHIQQAYPQMST